MKIISFTIISFFLATAPAFAQGLSQTSRGNKFNPDISLNGLLLYKNSAKDAESDGLQVQEVEMQFSSDVDAYLRAEAIIGLHKEETSSGHSHTYLIEPEEIFVETIGLRGITIKGGKFYANFAKYNTVHTHAQPFIYRSQLSQNIFGDEGLAETGISFSWLAPFPWFFDVTGQVIQPTNEEIFTDSHHAPAYVAKIKNLWELSDTTTLEFGLSGLKFANHGHGSDDVEEKTNLLGVDLTFKWRPLQQGRKHSFMWSTEFIHKDRAGSNTTKSAGLTTFTRFQFAKNWYGQAQYEHLGFSKNVGDKVTNAYAGLIGYVPTEFSSIRFQYDQIHNGTYKPEKRISAQVNFSIGAHPAHYY